MKLSIDPNVAAVVPGSSVPPDWATRATFRHPQAAERWLQALRASRSPEILPEVISMYKNVLVSVNEQPKYFVSMGAGGGRVDAELIPSLSVGLLQYIPIDLSYELCDESRSCIENLSSVPIGIVGEYEGGFGFIKTHLAGILAGNKIICSTSTIGNVDLGEYNFLRNLCEAMSFGDWLLLSLGTGALGASEERFIVDTQLDWWGIGGLLSCGISMRTREDLFEIESSLNERIYFRKGCSDVPKTQALEMWDKQLRIKLLNVRRYNLTALARWVVDTFPLLAISGREVTDEAEEHGVGAVLFMRL
jgi:Histidine-specific methyltransferase, SAM-dependent